MMTELAMNSKKQMGDVGGTFSSFSTLGGLPRPPPQLFHFCD
jgi:hypothetical protein